jgi:hypothetical protein
VTTPGSTQAQKFSSSIENPVPAAHQEDHRALVGNGARRETRSRAARHDPEAALGGQAEQTDHVVHVAGTQHRHREAAVERRAVAGVPDPLLERMGQPRTERGAQFGEEGLSHRGTSPPPSAAHPGSRRRAAGAP